LESWKVESQQLPDISCQFPVARMKTSETYPDACDL